MVIAFLLGNYLLRKDVVGEGYEPIVAEDITFRAAIGGILGAKIYYLIETIPTGQAAENISGLIEIIAGIFTLSGVRIAAGIQNFGAGLVFLGGLMGGMVAVSWYVYRNKLNWLKVADWVAPVLILGHGIGRIGCFLVGDDYGIPSNLPWACAFPNGLPPTIISVHPTQLYEMAAYFTIFVYYSASKRK
jgi:phosphatidylglycerol:prolipoprotein diacylglycerol transferase